MDNKVLYDIENNYDNKGKVNKKKIVFFIISIIVILVFALIIIFFPKKDDSISINLIGDKRVTINLGEVYNEYGYFATNKKGEDITNEVIVFNNIDTSSPGIYTITYQIGDIKVERVVEVIDLESLVTFLLVGEDTITIKKDSKYLEPGVVASQNNTIDLTNFVEIDSNLDTTTAGTYKITYKLNYKTVSKELIRTVIVKDMNLELNLLVDNKNFTNSKVIISVEVIGESFKSLVLPNKEEIDINKTNYEVFENGTYKFISYNEDGDKFEKTIEVTNIDKTKPTGSCIATINPSSTEIIVSAKDNLSGIKNYIYKDNNKVITNSKTNKFNYNKKTSKTVSVTIVDIATNENTINCEITDKSFLEPIKPSANENIVKSSETDTLKVYITKKTDYYITRVWAYEPYTQLNKYDSPEYGSKLYKPKDLLKMAKDNYKLDNKLLIGFNASGFYLKDTYDAASVSKYSKYNKTSVGTIVITNGKVIRNVYDKAYKTWFITGITPLNQLKIFTDLKASTDSEIENKKKWADEVINSGIRNTFTFASPLIENGVKSNTIINMPSANTKNKRQAICQVNSNNFVLITGSNLTREKLIDIMLDLKCETGTNLDGGGSIALLFKDKNSSTIETIIGNNRSLTEVGYFTE